MKGSTVSSLILITALGVNAQMSQGGQAPTRVLAAAQGFTIPPDQQTPIVLMTAPDAACTLHAEGEADPTHTLRLYANGEGYVRLHAGAIRASEQGARLLLDCTADGEATTYPLQVRAAYSPTADMPAPQTVVPIPMGSQAVPALTAVAAQKLSDQELIQLGYPPRLNAKSSPERYAKWLEMVSRPVTRVPAHSVRRSELSHQIADNPYVSDNWSGYVGQSPGLNYVAVQGEWTVPSIHAAESNNSTYSSLWVGLDGYGIRDLVQAGTSQVSIKSGSFYFPEYYSWTELLPNQPTCMISNLSVDPGDEMFVEVWVGNAQGQLSAAGPYGWFYLYNVTQARSVVLHTALSGTVFRGNDVEWIMERPTLSGNVFAQLSDYGSAAITDAYALNTKGSWLPAQSASNIQLDLYSEHANGYNDNNLLSSTALDGEDYILFYWHNFH